MFSLRYTLSSCHFVVSDMFLPFPCIWSVSLDLHWSRWQMGRALFYASESLGGNRSSKDLFLVSVSDRAGQGKAGGALSVCTLQRSLCSLAAQVSHPPFAQPLQAAILGGRWARPEISLLFGSPAIYLKSLWERGSLDLTLW